MGRIANDGRGRLGGRQKGTPNKPKNVTGDWLAYLLGGRNRARFERSISGEWSNTTPLVYALLLLVYVITKRADVSGILAGDVEPLEV